jgi:hypothetical protein
MLRRYWDANIQHPFAANGIQNQIHLANAASLCYTPNTSSGPPLAAWQSSAEFEQRWPQWRFFHNSSLIGLADFSARLRELRMITSGEYAHRLEYQPSAIGLVSEHLCVSEPDSFDQASSCCGCHGVFNALPVDFRIPE